MRRLWALDLETDTTGPGSRGLPVEAHLIAGVDAENLVDGQWPPLTSECGITYQRSEIDAGFWAMPDGEAPLALHAIHCGRHTLISASVEGGTTP